MEIENEVKAKCVFFLN